LLTMGLENDLSAKSFQPAFQGGSPHGIAVIGMEDQGAGPIRNPSQTLLTAADICAALRGNRLSSRWPYHSKTMLLQPI